MWKSLKIYKVCENRENPLRIKKSIQIYKYIEYTEGFQKPHKSAWNRTKASRRAAGSFVTVAPRPKHPRPGILGNLRTILKSIQIHENVEKSMHMYEKSRKHIKKNGNLKKSYNSIQLHKVHENPRESVRN